MRHAQPLHHAAASSGGGGADRIKLIVAIVLLAIAGGTFAWYFGVFGGRGASQPKSTNTADQPPVEQGTGGTGKTLKTPKEEPRGGPRMGDG